MEDLRRVWSRSKVYRVVLVVTIVYTLLRLVVQGVFLVGMSSLEPEGEAFVPVDLQIYANAARHFQARQDLYLKGSLERLEEHYPYAPSFALAFIPFLWLSPTVLVIVHTLLRIAAYWLLYVWWGRIFRRLGLDRANKMLALTLPVWLVFSAFWGDLGYLNIYLLVTLLATSLIDAVLNENLGWSVVWLSLILQVKPHWAFAAVVPLLLGSYRFFVKLVLGTLVVCLVIAGVTILVGGGTYGWRQYVDYVQFLSRLRSDFPWRGPDAPFLGYNHSISQITVYLIGVSSSTLRLATVIKMLLLVPLAWVSVRHLLRPVRRLGQAVPQLALDLTFALYLGAFIWLDMVWELSLGIVVFTYLLATLGRRWERLLVWAVFLPYALVDFWQLVSFVAFGPDVILPGPYILTDPSIYVPLIMIVILTFYVFLVKRLWAGAPVAQGRRMVESYGS